MTQEPFATAVILGTVGVLLGGSILVTRAAGRAGVPIALGFILLGMLAGSESFGGIAFENYTLAFRLGVLALVLIIFDGGLNTPLEALRTVLRPAIALATVGVVLTATIVALFARLAGLSWSAAWLMGAVVSPTDAAAVFATLRTSGLTLRTRVGHLLEAESGFNDPVAVLLTVTVTAIAIRFTGEGTGASIWMLPVTAVREIAIGAAAGAAAGIAGTKILARAKLDAPGLYPVLTLALALSTFAVPSVIGGSGFLAVYVAAVFLTRKELPYQPSILRVHDAFAWLAQIGMFIVLGLLSFPSRMVDAAAPGLAIAAALTLVARPIAVAVCVLPFGYSLRETLFLGIMGLRGAVPVVLATMPVIAGVPGARRLFDVVFFIVVANTLIPGTAAGWLARKLHVVAPSTPEPAATIVIESSTPMGASLHSYFVDEALPVCGATLADIPFPEGTAATMVLRGSAMLVAEGSTELRAGDHVYVLATPDTEPVVQLLFGRPEEG